MPLPVPAPGLVISFSYLWRHEHNAGKEEGRKPRPCVVILAVEGRGDDTIVTVAPVTHLRPDSSAPAKEIPKKVKHALGLDDEASWVILDEVNQFAWPGYDVQPIPGRNGRCDYGFLPPRLFDDIRNGILDLVAKRRLVTTNRD